MRRAGSEDIWFAVCLLAVATIAVIDLSTSSTTNLTGTLTFLPFLASATCSPRRTLIVSALALSVGLILLAIDNESMLTSVIRALALAAAAALAPVVAGRQWRSDRRMSDLERVAEVAQLAVLTPVPPVAGPVALSTAYRSASREALIGGDLYAVVERPPGVRIIVGDVRGKGLDAVQLAALVLSVFRETALSRSSLADVATATDRRLVPFLGPEDFVTAVFADIDLDGHVGLVSCGHPPPVLIDAHGRRMLEITRPAAPLGLSPQPIVEELWLEPHDRLLFYTDGLVEARARAGGFVDLDRLLAKMPSDPTDVALRRLLERLDRVAGDSRDDLALLLAEYLGDPTPQPIVTPVQRMSS